MGVVGPMADAAVRHEDDNEEDDQNAMKPVSHIGCDECPGAPVRHITKIQVFFHITIGGVVINK